MSKVAAPGEAIWNKCCKMKAEQLFLNFAENFGPIKFNLIWKANVSDCDALTIQSHLET